MKTVVIRADCDPVNIAKIFLRLGYKKHILQKTLVIPVSIIDKRPVFNIAKKKGTENYIEALRLWAINWCSSELGIHSTKLVFIPIITELPLSDVLICTEKTDRFPERLAEAIQLYLEWLEARKYTDPESYKPTCLEKDLFIESRIEVYYNALEIIRPRVEREKQKAKEIIEKLMREQLGGENT